MSQRIWRYCTSQRRQRPLLPRVTTAALLKTPLHGNNACDTISKIALFVRRVFLPYLEHSELSYLMRHGTEGPFGGQTLMASFSPMSSRLELVVNPQDLTCLLLS